MKILGTSQNGWPISSLTKMDFARLTVEFFETSTVFPAKRDRYVAVGELNGETIVAVVFKPLGSEAVSVISMRPASRRERKAI